MAKQKTLELIIAARDRLSPALRDGAKSAGELNQKLGGVQKELAKLDQQQRSARKGFQADLAKGRMESLEREAGFGDRIARQKLQILRIEEQFQARRQTLLRIQRSELASTNQKRTATQQLLALDRERARMLAMQVARHREADALLLSQTRLERSRRLRQGIGGVATGVATGIGGPMAGITAGLATGMGGPAAAAGAAAFAVTAGLAAAVREFAAFEKAMSNVRAISRATDGDFKALSATARELGRTTVFTAVQAAEAMGELAKAGYDAKQIISAMPAVLSLAAAGDLEMAEASGIAVSIMRGMGLEASQLTEAVDVLARAFTTSNTDLRELGEAFSYVGPMAKTAGFSLRDTAAFLQVLANAGLKAERGGTGLRQVIASLTNLTPQAAAQLKDLGIVLQDSGGNILPLIDIMAQFEEKLDGLGSGRKLQILGQIFETRAATSFAAALEQGTDELRRYGEVLENSTGEAARVAAEKLNNLSGDVTRFSSALSELKIAVGEQAGGPLRGFVQGATDGVNAINEMSDALARGKVSWWELATPITAASAAWRTLTEDMREGERDLQARHAKIQEDREEDRRRAREVARNTGLDENDVLQQMLADREYLLAQHRERVAAATRAEEEKKAAAARISQAINAEEMTTLRGRMERLKAERTLYDELAEAKARLQGDLAAVQGKGAPTAGLEGEIAAIDEAMGKLRVQRSQQIAQAFATERQNVLEGIVAASRGEGEAGIAAAAALAEARVAASIETRLAALDSIASDQRALATERKAAEEAAARLRAERDAMVTGAGDRVRTDGATRTEELAKREREQTQRRHRSVEQAMRAERMTQLRDEIRLGNSARETELRRLQIQEEFSARRERLNESLETATEQQRREILGLIAALDQMEAKQLDRAGQDDDGRGGQFRAIDSVASRFTVFGKSGVKDAASPEAASEKMASAAEAIKAQVEQSRKDKAAELAASGKWAELAQQQLREMESLLRDSRDSLKRLADDNNRLRVEIIDS